MPLETQSAIEKLDTEALIEGVATQVRESLGRLLAGASEDVEKYASNIARDTVQAMSLPPERRDAVLAEIKGQLRTLGEINRIRAVNEGWTVVETVVEAIQRALTTALAVVATSLA